MLKNPIMKYSTFVLLFLSMFVAFAVDKVDYHVPRDYSVIPPSPEAGKLFEYNEISVNNNIGIPDISFNLFEITEGNISVPLVLAYSGGGISREEMEGNAGLGWNVTCGSNITRVVYGAPDEAYRGNGVHGLFKLNFEENEFRRKLIEQVPFNPNDRHFFVNHLMWMVEKGQRYMEGRSDLANDIFHISGLGMSGTFIYNDNKDIVLSTNSSIRISPSKCMNSYPNEFAVMDNIGNKYVFNERELTKYDYFYGSPFLKQMEDSVIYTSAWHVSSITNLLGQQVKFLYEQSDGYEWRSTHYESVAQLTNVDLDIYTPRNVASLSTVRYMPKVIKSISTSSIDVVFEYKKMQIGRFKKQVVKAIKVFRKGIVEPARTFSFEYTLMDDPFNNVTNNEFWGRNIMLSSIRDNGRLVYEFNYYSDEQHEFANTPFSADFGGGYNGKDNVSLVPSYKQYYGWGADRSVNPKSVFIGSLKDIKYPTGGKTTIEWESNEYGYIRNVPVRKSINSDVVEKNTIDTIRMCLDEQYKKLKISDYIVRPGQEILLDISKYFLMNPANLMTTEYEYRHVDFPDNYNYPHVTISNSETGEIKKIIFLDKHTIEVEHNKLPILTGLSEGVYDIELKYPMEIEGAKEFLQAEFRYPDLPAGKIYIIKNIYSSVSDEKIIRKDFWTGLRVRRVLTYPSEKDEPIIKDYFYGDYNPDTSEGVIQELPDFKYVYDMVADNPYLIGEANSQVVVLGSVGFPQTPLGDFSSIQYPMIVTRLSMKDRFEPNSYLNNKIEKMEFSTSYNYENADINETEFLGYQPVSVRMYTSMKHRRGNLVKKSVGAYGHRRMTSYSFNIHEKKDSSIFTTQPFVLCDYVHCGGTMSETGPKAMNYNYGIGKYRLIPYNKTLREEEITYDNGFNARKSYEYFYNSYTNNIDYNLVKSASTTDSEGRNEKVNYTYLKIGDTFSPNIETEVTTIGGKVISGIRNEYNHNAQLIRKYVLDKEVGDYKLLLSETKETTQSQIENISRLQYEYKYNSRGNLVQVSYNGIPLVSYIWGYYGHHPIMEVQGITIYDLVQYIAKSGFDSESAYEGKICDNNQIGSLVKSLRTLYPTLKFKTFKYHWLIGLEESVDERGVSSYYSYDKYGRLETMSDFNNYLIKKISYHYATDNF